MNFFSNTDIKIDPKQRCLHRIAHTINKKFKKNYFSFFVILETMKNKNIYLK